MILTKPDRTKECIMDKDSAAAFILNACNQCRIGVTQCHADDAFFCNHMKQFLTEKYSNKPNILHGHRMMHSIGVANFLYTYAITHAYSNEIAEDWYLMGLLHDIGYLTNPTGTHHGKQGAAILSRNGYSKQYCDVIKHHGLMSDTISKEQELLWLADLSIDHNGDFVGFISRYKNICKRYGADDEKIKNVEPIIAYLQAHYPQYQ